MKRGKLLIIVITLALILYWLREMEVSRRAVEERQQQLKSHDITDDFDLAEYD